ncbi:MAG: hypothetical protein V3T47_04420, partial [Gammaproteobacteria bacterium]
FVGLDSFTYTVSDPSGAQATGLVVIDVTTPDEGAFGIGGGNGGEIVIEPVDENAWTEEEPEAASYPSAASTPTVSLLVTPDNQLGSLNVPEWDEGADLLLLVGGEVDDSGADIMRSKALALYSQTLNTVGGSALDGFELASLDPASLAQALDALRRGMSGLEPADDDIDSLIVVQISTGLGAVLSVGIVSWILRGGTLAATLLSSTPMWKGFDPLPMLMGRRRKKDDEEERDGDDDGEIVPEHMRTQMLRERHLEDMFSTSEQDRQTDQEE